MAEIASLTAGVNTVRSHEIERRRGIAVDYSGGVEIGKQLGLEGSLGEIYGEILERELAVLSLESANEPSARDLRLELTQREAVLAPSSPAQRNSSLEQTVIALAVDHAKRILDENVSQAAENIGAYETRLRGLQQAYNRRGVVR